ncbi:MAG: DUF4831 family protein [Prevotella sp.]|nr:DUF4831 family protein [Prevotella sp.]
MRKLICAILVMLSCVANAQTGVTEESASYYLPKTALRFALQVEKNAYTPGRFQKYTSKYYGVVPISNKEVTYSIVNLGMETIGIPDSTQLFTIQLKGKSKGSDIHLSEGGQLLSINAEPRVVKLRPPFQPAPKVKPMRTKYSNLKSSSEESEQQLAQEAIDRIVVVQEKINKLKLGEPVELEAGETLEKLKREDKALTALFFGTEVKDTTEQVVVIIPEKEVNRQVMFRLNPTNGAVSTTASTGVPYYITVEDAHSYPKPRYELPDNKKEGCVYTRVPGKIKVTIHREDNFMGAFDIYAAQFGFIDELAGTLFKNYRVQMILSPIVGYQEKISYQ